MSKKDEGGRPRSGAVSSEEEMNRRAMFSDPQHDVIKSAKQFQPEDKATLMATLKGIMKNKGKASTVSETPSERVDFSDPKHNVMEAAQHFKMSDKETLLATFKGIGDRMKKAASSGRSSPASDASSVSPMGTPTSLDSPKKGSGFVKS